MSNKVPVQTLVIPPLSKRQGDIYKAWQDESNKYITVCCGRQVGKSWVAIVIAITTALNPLYKSKGEKNCKIGFFMPLNSGAFEQYERAIEIIGDNVLSGVKTNSTRKTIKFNNGSVIKFMGAESQRAIRGNFFDYIIVDEACYINSNMWTNVIAATLSRARKLNRGKVLITSTPKEKNWFYDYFNKKAKGYTSIKFTSYESGMHSLEYLEELREMTPKVDFDNEYMAEFIDGSKGLFELDRITFNNVNDISDRKGSIAGIDWGFTNDYTALVILNTNKEVCYVNRWKNVGLHELLPKIVSALKENGRPLVYAETNGIGGFPTDDLKRLYGAVTGFTTTASNKTEMIMKMAKDLLTKESGNKLKLLNIEYLKEEFNNYGYTTVNNGMPKFGNMNQSTHDDTVMATAIANYHFERFSLSF